MYNHFARCEQDFRKRIEAGFPGANSLTRDFLEHLADPNIPRELWSHQWQAHYGDLWPTVLALKKKFDPQQILNPGFVLYH